MDAPRRRKNYDYFEYALNCAQSALRAAHYLHQVFSGFDASRVGQQLNEMHTIENDADMRKHEMLTHLVHEFMTPIEREDIVSLSQELDNVVDAIDDVMQRVYMYNVETIRPDALQLTGLIVSCCESLVEVMKEFRNFRKSKTINRKCIEVNNIENQGDKLFAACMHRLYTEREDLRHVLIWSTMFESLETCLDACEDAVDIIEGVIMKNT